MDDGRGCMGEDSRGPPLTHVRGYVEYIITVDSTGGGGHLLVLLIRPSIKLRLLLLPVLSVVPVKLLRANLV